MKTQCILLVSPQYIRLLVFSCVERNLVNMLILNCFEYVESSNITKLHYAYTVSLLSNRSLDDNFLLEVPFSRHELEIINFD
jgi:hypothetical protein